MLSRCPPSLTDYQWDSPTKKRDNDTFECLQLLPSKNDDTQFKSNVLTSNKSLLDSSPLSPSPLRNVVDPLDALRTTDDPLRFSSTFVTPSPSNTDKTERNRPFQKSRYAIGLENFESFRNAIANKLTSSGSSVHSFDSYLEPAEKDDPDRSSSTNALSLGAKIAQGKIRNQIYALDNAIHTDRISEKNFLYLEPLQKMLESLNDTTEALWLYPLKWVLATRTIDKFTRALTEYIKQLSITVSAEYSKNIFHRHYSKMANVRDPLSRVYTELVALDCNKNLTPDASLYSKMIRNIRIITDPVASIYSLTYLVQRVFQPNPGVGDSHEVMFQIFNLLQSVFSSPHAYYLKQRRTTYAQFLNLVSPGLSWILRCIGPYKTDVLLIENTLNACTKQAVGCFLHAIISNGLISTNSPFFFKVIQEYDDTFFPRSRLYRVLLAFLLSDTRRLGANDSKIGDIWTNATQFTNMSDFLFIASDFLDDSLGRASSSDFTNSVLETVIARAAAVSESAEVQSHLRRIADKMLTRSVDLIDAYDKKHFSTILTLSRGLSVSESFTAALFRTRRPILSSVVIESVLDALSHHVAQFNVFTVDSARKSVVRVISKFVEKLDFGQDFEKHLDFILKCRGAFIDLPVKHVLVQQALNILAQLNCRRHCTNNNNDHRRLPKETTSLMFTAITFCYITISSVDDVGTKLNLYLLAGQMALASRALAPSESLFRAAIDALVTVFAQRSNLAPSARSLTEEAHLVDFLHSFVGVLVAVPGHPKLGPFYLLKDLYQAVNAFSWESTSTAKARLFVSMIRYLSACLHMPPPYVFDGVETNEQMYAGTTEYEDEIRAFINELVFKILESIQPAIEERSSTSKSSKNSSENNTEQAIGMQLDLLNLILSSAKSSTELSKLVSTLYEAVSHTRCHKAYLNNTLNWARCNAETGDHERLFLYFWRLRGDR